MREEFFDILESLKCLPPNHVYDLAPKNFILRGYDYYSRERPGDVQMECRADPTHRICPRNEAI